MSLVTERTAVGAVLLAVPIALLLVARQGEFTALAAFSPLFFPRAVLWLWVAFASLSLSVDVLALRRGRRAAAEVADDTAAPPAMARVTALRVVAIVAAMGAYVMLLPELGFLLCSVGFAVLTLLALGIRSPPLLLGCGVAMPAAVFALFNHGLGLPLPTSPFSYLF